MMLLLFLKPSLLTSKEIDKGRDRKRTKEGKKNIYRKEKKIKDREGGAFVGLPSSCFLFTFPQHLAFPHSKVPNLVWVQLPRA